MKHTLTYGRWVEELIVGILEYEEITGSGSIDLRSVCEQFGLEANEDWLVRFLNENRDTLGSGAHMFGLSSFSLSPFGREKAIELRRSRQPKTFLEKLTNDTSQRLINVGNFAIALIALIVAALALLKSS